MKIQVTSGSPVSAESFMAKNSDLRRASAGVAVHVARLSPHGQLRVLLEVTDKTRTRDLREAISLAKEWRARLALFQGPSLDDQDSFLDYLLTRHEKGRVSFPSLARELNAALSQAVTGAAKYKQSEEKQHALDEGQELLAYLGYVADEIEEIVAGANRNLALGLSPFMRGSAEYPISTYQVRTAVNNWRRSPIQKVLVEARRRQAQEATEF